MSTESERADLIRDLCEAVEGLRAEGTRLRGAMEEIVCLANEALAASTLDAAAGLARQIRATASRALAPEGEEQHA